MKELDEMAGEDVEGVEEVELPEDVLEEQERTHHHSSSCSP